MSRKFKLIKYLESSAGISRMVRLASTEEEEQLSLFQPEDEGHSLDEPTDPSDDPGDRFILSGVEFHGPESQVAFRKQIILLLLRDYPERDKADIIDEVLAISAHPTRFEYDTNKYRKLYPELNYVSPPYVDPRQTRLPNVPPRIRFTPDPESTERELTLLDGKDLLRKGEEERFIKEYTETHGREPGGVAINRELGVHVPEETLRKRILGFENLLSPEKYERLDTELRNAYNEADNIRASFAIIIDDAEANAPMMPESRPADTFSSFDDYVQDLIERIHFYSYKALLNAAGYSIFGVRVGRELPWRQEQHLVQSFFSDKQHDWFVDPEKLKDFIEEVPSIGRDAKEAHAWHGWQRDIAHWHTKKLNAIEGYTKGLEQTIEAFKKGMRFEKRLKKSLEKEVAKRLDGVNSIYAEYVEENLIDELNVIYLRIVNQLESNSESESQGAYNYTPDLIGGLGRDTARNYHGKVTLEQIESGISNQIKGLDLNLLFHNKTQMYKIVDQFADLILIMLKGTTNKAVYNVVQPSLQKVGPELYARFFEETFGTSLPLAKSMASHLRVLDSSSDFEESEKPEEKDEFEALTEEAISMLIGGYSNWASEVGMNFRSALIYPKFIIKDPNTRDLAIKNLRRFYAENIYRLYVQESSERSEYMILLINALISEGKISLKDLKDDGDIHPIQRDGGELSNPKHRALEDRLAKNADIILREFRDKEFNNRSGKVISKHRGVSVSNRFRSKLWKNDDNKYDYLHVSGILDDYDELIQIMRISQGLNIRGTFTLHGARERLAVIRPRHAVMPDFQDRNRRRELRIEREIVEAGYGIAKTINTASFGQVRGSEMQSINYALQGVVKHICKYYVTAATEFVKDLRKKISTSIVSDDADLNSIVRADYEINNLILELGIPEEFANSAWLTDTISAQFKDGAPDAAAALTWAEGLGEDEAKGYLEHIKEMKRTGSVYSSKVISKDLFKSVADPGYGQPALDSSSYEVIRENIESLAQNMRTIEVIDRAQFDEILERYFNESSLFKDSSGSYGKRNKMDWEAPEVRWSRDKERIYYSYLALAEEINYIVKVARGIPAAKAQIGALTASGMLGATFQGRLQAMGEVGPRGMAKKYHKIGRALRLKSFPHKGLIKAWEAELSGAIENNIDLNTSGSRDHLQGDGRGGGLVEEEALNKISRFYTDYSGTRGLKGGHQPPHQVISFMIIKKFDINNPAKILNIFKIAKEEMQAISERNFSYAEMDLVFGEVFKDGAGQLRNKISKVFKMASYAHNRGHGLSASYLKRMIRDPNFKHFGKNVTIDKYFDMCANLNRLGGLTALRRRYQPIIDSLMVGGMVSRGFYKRVRSAYRICREGFKIRPNLEGADPSVLDEQERVRALLATVDTELTAVRDYSAYQIYNDQVVQKDERLFDLNWTVKNKNFRFRVLKTYDPLHFKVGIETQCCQRLGGLGEAAAIDSYVNPLAGVLILDLFIDGSWVLAGQSYFHYVPKDNGYILDNVETNRTYPADVIEARTGYTKEALYALLAKRVEENFNVSYFLSGKGYSEIDVSSYGTKHLNGDPRSFHWNKKYTDFRAGGSIDLLSPEFEVPDRPLGAEDRKRKIKAIHQGLSIRKRGIYA